MGNHEQRGITANETVVKEALQELFLAWSGQLAQQIEPLPASGSHRRYYRLTGPEGQTAVGAFHDNLAENETFLRYSRHFKAQGLPVPTIYGEDLPRNVYLQEDLGTLALYDLLPPPGAPFTTDLVTLYQEVLQQLAALQVRGGQGLDAPVFDREAMRWDLHYFKYFYLKLLDAPYLEAELEADFSSLIDWLGTADTSHFMFRDFQSRNIMLPQGEPFFIDYQGGKKGPLQYDLVSVLWQAKANIPFAIREALVGRYLDALEQYLDVDRTEFNKYYLGFALLRTLQVLAVYGLRGLVERKAHFLESIPFALDNLAWLQQQGLLADLPELARNVAWVVDHPPVIAKSPVGLPNHPLVVQVGSFSYKKGLPPDSSGHGGGFIFDCRFMHNPGRYTAYKTLTGRDQAVKDFFAAEPAMDLFLQQVFAMTDPAVENYLERQFDSLSIHFGCTGGQHRSVYAADRLADHLSQKYGVQIQLVHREQNWEERR